MPKGILENPAIYGPTAVASKRSSKVPKLLIFLFFMSKTSLCFWKWESVRDTLQKSSKGLLTPFASQLLNLNIYSIGFRACTPSQSCPTYPLIFWSNSIKPANYFLSTTSCSRNATCIKHRHPHFTSPMSTSD